MKDVLRILAKDVRRLWFLAVAVLLLALFAALYPQLGVSIANQGLLGASEATRMLAVGLLAVLLIQEDVVTSDRADWITRPMTAGMLAGAKGLFLLLLVVLPHGVLSGAVCRLYAVPAGRCLLVALDESARMAVVVGAFALIGALTPALLAAVLLLAGCAAGFIVARPFLELAVPDISWSYLGSTSPLLAVMICLPLLIALWILQYRLRRPWITAGVALLATALVVPNLGRLQAQSFTKGPAPNVAATIESPRGFWCGLFDRPFPLSSEVVLGADVTYLLPKDGDYYISPRSMRFQATDGRTFHAKVVMAMQGYSWEMETLPSISSPWSSFPHQSQQLFGCAPPEWPRGSMEPLGALSGAEVERWRGARGHLDVDLEVYQRVAGDMCFLPVQPEAHVALAGNRVMILSIVPFEKGLNVRIESTGIESGPAAVGFLVFALVNERTHEVSFEEFGGYSQREIAQSFLVMTDRRTLAFFHRWKPGGEAPAAGLSRDWVSQAHLVIVPFGGRELAGATMDVPEFAMPDNGGTL